MDKPEKEKCDFTLPMVALFLDDNKTNDHSDGQENGKKLYVYIKQQLCTCIALFCTFQFAIVALLRHETSQFLELALWSR